MQVSFVFKFPWSVRARRVCLLSCMLLANPGFALAQTVAAAPSPDQPAAAAAAAAPAPVRTAKFEILVLEVVLNDQNLLQAALPLRPPDGRLLASVDDIALWRLRLPEAAIVAYEGEQYLPLDAFNQLSYRLDSVRQALRAIFCHL